MRALVLAPLLACALFGIIVPQRAAAGTSGGTNIVNTASATYSDAAAHKYGTVSNTVTVVVAQLSAIVVNPKQAAPNASTDAVAVGTPAVRTFTITNASNISDAYQLETLDAGVLKVTSVQWLTANGPITTGVGGTVSPTVVPGGSIQVQVTIAVTGLQVGASQSVVLGAHTTVTGTANGIVHDSGTQWIVVSTGPSLSGPGGPNSQVSKTVNSVSIVQGTPGTAVMFSIAMMNTGGAPALGLVISDPVPSGLTIVANSAQINGQPAGAQASINGQTISFSIPSLAPGAQLVVSFDASLPPGATLGSTYLNIANVTAQNLPAQVTTPASVLAGTANIVFDGYSGGSLPVGGAVVSLLNGSGGIVSLAGSTQSSSRLRMPDALSGTSNPFVTANDGAYGFALSAAQIGSGGRYYLTISANGYLNRKIALDISPAVQNYFYNVTQSSQDGQPLAIAGGFSLTKQNVALKDVFGLFGNLPLFPQRTIVVTKTVDKEAAAAGEALLYTLTFDNQSQAAIGATTIVDTLPPGLVYLPNTSRVDGIALEPKVDGRTLTWTLDALVSGQNHTITYAATIFGSVAVGTDLTNTVVVSGLLPGTALSTAGSANVTVRVLAGALSPRRIVTGRVFIDVAGTGHFKRGDTPLAGVRVLLEDGSFAITDLHGQFSFPSVRPGAHVLRLDPLSLPGNVRIDPHVPMTSTHATQRLLHGLFDDATMEDVQFALEPAS